MARTHFLCGRRRQASTHARTELRGSARWLLDRERTCHPLHRSERRERTHGREQEDSLTGKKQSSLLMAPTVSVS